jgi:serine O-acetyltransferase
MFITKEIRDDLFRYTGKSNFISFLKGFKYPGFVYLVFFRKIQRVKKYTPFWFIYRFFLRHYSYKFGFQIPYKTQIGRGFYIGHFGTIVINGNVTIGNNCNISQNVTLGQTNRGELKGVPKIGDKVWVGAGAVIVGNIIIGNNVLIAANAYVNFNVPDNCIVIGNPGKIISQENPTRNYIDNEV